MSTERAPHGVTVARGWSLVTHVALSTFSTAMLLALFSFYLLDYVTLSDYLKFSDGVSGITICMDIYCNFATLLSGYFFTNDQFLNL